MAIQMVTELNEVILQELTGVFKLRVLNHASEDEEEAWKFHQASLILTKASPRCPSLLKLISILSFLSKLYAAVLLAMVGDSVAYLSKYQFAFT